MYYEDPSYFLSLSCAIAAIGGAIGVLPGLIAWRRKNRTLAIVSVLLCAGVVVLTSDLTLTLVVAAILGFLALRSGRSTSQKSAVQEAASAKPAATPPSPPPQTTTTRTRPPAPTPVKKNAIFVSYRRDDSAEVVGRMYDRLVQHFGKEAIFKDVDSIPFGVDFRTHLASVISNCGIVLAVIGRDWLDIRDEEGQRRLDDPADFVRIEIESALQRDVPVVPLLVRNARLPKAEQLPEGLTTLAFRNGTSVRNDPDFHTDMDRLIKSIEQFVR